MNDEAWNADFVRSIGMLLSGNAIEEVNERGEPIIGDTLLVLLNAHHDKVPFTLPPLDGEQQWQRVFDTRDPRRRDRVFKPGARYPLRGRSVAVLQGHAARPRAPAFARGDARPRRRARCRRHAGAGRRRKDELEVGQSSGSRVDDAVTVARRRVGTADSATPGYRLANRVVIEHVRPRVDDGRFPIKRTPGERVDVTRDVFADGHDVLDGRACATGTIARTVDGRRC